MTATVRVFKNVLSLLSERLVVPVVNLLLVVVIARYMGAEGLGRYAFIVGFVAFFDIFLDLGINTLIVREVARDRSERHSYASRAVTLKLAVLPLVALAITVFLGLSPQEHEVVMSFYLFLASSMFFALSETFNSLYKSYERMDFVALTVFVRQSALVVAVVAGMQAGRGILGIASAYFWVGLVYLLLNFILFNLKVDRVRIRLDGSFHKGLFRQSLPFITLGFFFLLFFRIDVVLTSLVADDVQAGLFSASSKIVSSVLLLSEAFLMAIFPIISRYGEDSAGKMRSAVRMSFHLLGLFAFPVAAGLMVCGGSIMPLLFGEGFSGSVPMFSVLCAAIPLAYLSSALHYVLMARDRQIQGFYTVVAHVAVLALADYWLVGLHGGMGAAMATLGVTASLFASLGYMVYRDLGPAGALAELPRPLMASAAMAALLHYVGLGLGPTIVLGVLTYTALILILRGVNSQDLGYVREIWGHFLPAPEGRGDAGR